MEASAMTEVGPEPPGQPRRGRTRRFLLWLVAGGSGLVLAFIAGSHLLKSFDGPYLAFMRSHARDRFEIVDRDLFPDFETYVVADVGAADFERFISEFQFRHVIRAEELDVFGPCNGGSFAPPWWPAEIDCEQVWTRPLEYVKGVWIRH